MHDSYGRAAIRLDGKERVIFSWIDAYRQDTDSHEIWERTGIWYFSNPDLKEKWDREGTYSEKDFLSAALQFIQMPVDEALNSENYIIKIFAIMDRRVGKRRLREIFEKREYLRYPEWARQFFDLRFLAESIS